MKKDDKNYSRLSNVEIRDLLMYYGIQVTLEEACDLEIKSCSNHRVCFFKKSTNEEIISDLIGNIYKNAIPSVLLSTRNVCGGCVVEQYHEIENVSTFREASEKAIEARGSEESKILSRAYVDVDTKYGNFVLLIEENYRGSGNGPYRHVSLMLGQKKHVYIPLLNDFNLNDACIFRMKYKKDIKLNQWNLGRDDSLHGGPNCKIKHYGRRNVFSLSRAKYSCAILLNGNIESDSLVDGITEPFTLEERRATSKAFFSDGTNKVSIFKIGSRIDVSYGESEVLESFSSLSDKEFTIDDFVSAISVLNSSSIDDNFKKDIIFSLMAYINIHDGNNFESLYRELVLENRSFDDLLKVLTSSDVCSVVETALDEASSIFGISIDELLGSPTKEKKHAFRPKA